MKKIIYFWMILMTFLTGCGTLEVSFEFNPVLVEAGVTPTPGASGQTPGPAGQGGQEEPSPGALSLDSTSAEIQAAMLESAAKWDTIWMDGEITWYDPTGSGQPPQVFHEQAWIDQPGSRFRVLLGPGDAPAIQMVSHLAALSSMTAWISAEVESKDKAPGPGSSCPP